MPRDVDVNRIIACVIEGKKQQPQALEANELSRLVVELGVDPIDAPKVVDSVIAGFRAGVNAVLTCGVSARCHTPSGDIFYDLAFRRGRASMRFTTPGWVLAKRATLVLIVVGVVGALVVAIRGRDTSVSQRGAGHMIYFHEDDYCQQEILPLEALKFCQQEIKNIGASSAAHAAPDGIGWTDIYVREEPPRTLVELGITLDRLRAIMGNHLPEITDVRTGYSSYSERCPNTSGYGYDDSCIVYVDWNDDNVIEHIWTSIFTDNEKRREDVINAMQSLGQDYPLLYVDWAWSFATPLDDSGELRNRIAGKCAEIEKRMKEED